MTEQKAFEIIRSILVENFSWIDPTHSIDPEDSLQEDLEIDSLAMVNLQVAIEDSFAIRFDPIAMDLLEVFDTVGSLTKFLEDTLEKSNQKG